MGDFYTEQLIKKKTDGKDIAIKILLIVLTVISFLSLFIAPFNSCAHTVHRGRRISVQKDGCGV